MAFVPTAPYFTVRFMDSGENETSRTFRLKDDTFTPATDTLDDLYTAGGGLLTVLAAVTEAEILGYTLHLPVLEDAVTVPGAGVEVENTAEITLRLDAPGNKTDTVNIPAAPSALFVSTTGKNRNIVKNPSDSASLQAYVDWLIANATISDGEDLAAAPFVEGVRVHKARRGG